MVYPNSALNLLRQITAHINTEKFVQTLLLIFGLFTANLARAQEVVENVGNLRPTLPQFVQQEEQETFELPRIAEGQTTGASGNQPTFRLNDVTFSGNQIVSSGTLKEVISKYIGKMISVSELESIRVALTQFYVSAGYINSGVILPSQDVNNGIIKFQVIEGILNKINIVGMDDLAPGYIECRLLPHPSAAFNLNEFQERYQLLLNDPMFEKFQGQFRPGNRPGESILDLKVVPASPFGLTMQADNYGSASSGEGQLSLNGYYLNPLGVGDNIALNLRKREGALSGNLMYQLPLNHHDTRLTVQFGFNDSEVIEDQIEVLDIESEYQSTDVSLSHPVINSLTESLLLAGSLSVRENEGRLLQLPFSFAAGENNGFSRVSALRLSAQGSIRTDKDVWSGHIRYSHGLTAFNATDNNNERPDSDFSSLLLQLQYARLLSHGVQLSVRADAQFSSDGLLPLEQFAIGGANTIRGYRENELVRDEGYSASIQIASPLFDELDFSGRYGKLDAYLFSDYGEGKFKADVQDSDRTLWSAGIGLIWEPISGWQIEAAFAHAFKTPPTRANSVLQDDGIHVRISGVLF